MEEEISQKNLIIEFFKANQNKDVPHPEVVDWLTAEYTRRTGKVFRDPDRGIRKLYQEGFLIKVSKGVYRYDPEQVGKNKVTSFSAAQKEEILKRGGYRCAICGRGKKEGMELHIDHIKPADRGGKAIVENGQVLCSQHNFFKKNLSQSESAKRFFINFHQTAKAEGEKELEEFSREVLELYEKHNINGHIVWKDKDE